MIRGPLWLWDNVLFIFYKFLPKSKGGSGENDIGLNNEFSNSFLAGCSISVSENKIYNSPYVFCKV